MLALVCLALVIVGCSMNTAIKPVVEKTYRTIVTVENYVINTDSTTLVSKLQKVNSTLCIVSRAMSFVATKISNPETKKNVDLIVSSIQEITALIETVDVSKIDTVRTAILEKIKIAKDAVTSIANYCEINLVGIKLQNNAVIASEDMLDAVANDLTSELNKAR